MTNEELQKAIDHEVENQSCVIDLESEVLKMLTLIEDIKENILSRSYVLEKVSKLSTGYPIILHPQTFSKYLIKKYPDANRYEIIWKFLCSMNPTEEGDEE